MILSKKDRVKVLEMLQKEYPDAKCELNHSTPFQLLVATILSAQCTDKRVNIVTKKLFEDYKTPEDFITLTEEDLAKKIRSTGFYRNKSKNIINTANILVKEYNSNVPGSLEELIMLPGVGRKTANVVLSNAFNINAIAVDTHVFRVANRLGFASATNVLDTEKQLMENIDKNRWSQAHNLFIFHGRRRCKARNPKCEDCIVKEKCKYIKGK